MVYFDSCEFKEKLDARLKEIEVECTTNGVLDTKMHRNRIDEFGSDANILSMVRSCMYDKCCWNCRNRSAGRCDIISTTIPDMKNACEYWEER